MIGKRLKKIAESYSMNIEKHYAWGQIDRYLFALDEGVGYIGVTISVTLADNDDRRNTLAGYISSISKQHKIRSSIINHCSIVIQISDVVNAKKYVIAFIEHIRNKLKELDVPGAELCAVCSENTGEMLHDVKIDTGVTRMHKKCYNSIKQATDEKQEEYDNESKNHFIGVVGALIGGIVGTIPWIIVYMLGFFVGWLGFIIGIAANKGYEILGGKNSKAKPFIIIIVVIICVLLAQVTCEMIELYNYLQEEGVELGIIDMFRVLWETFIAEAEYSRAVLGSVAMGLIFAGLGTFGLIKNMMKQSKRVVAKVELLN